MEGELATSRYTFRLPLHDGFALFNGNTGSVFELRGADAAELSALLSGPRVLVPVDAFGAELAARLRRNGFLLDADVDEVAVVRERYWAARRHAPVALVVTTTMDCNLGCYYCYESRSSDALEVNDVDQLVAIARERLGRQGKRSLHVDWYGGEPMMNLEFLERASLALQALCASEGISYQASAISNGTHWPDDVGSFVMRHRIRQVQISFDGLKVNHDRRRRYRAGYRPSPDASSFDRAAGLVDRLLRHVRVDVRYNVDPANAGDFAGFLDLARQRGWFDAPFRCVIMPARLAAYSDRSAFMRRHQLSHEQFEALEAGARRLLPVVARDEPDTVGGFPHPKTSVCGALAFDSAVVGADGMEYRCGLQVGETHRAVGRFGTVSEPGSFPDSGWWDAFDPTVLPTCSRCSFLPLCWGGCPKRHLEGSRADIASEGRFWRTQLPRLIATGLGGQPPPDFAFTEADQFRGEAAATS
jgi:uncharacterized protein